MPSGPGPSSPGCSPRKSAIHLVSAFCQQNRLVLGQLATEEKSNEITAIPKLLELLDLAGATVSIDAMGCQKTIAKTILDGGGEYLLAVKDNHKDLHADIRFFFDEAIGQRFDRLRHVATEHTDADHGRLEQRRLYASADVAWRSTWSKRNRLCSSASPTNASIAAGTYLLKVLMNLG